MYICWYIVSLYIEFRQRIFYDLRGMALQRWVQKSCIHCIFVHFLTIWSQFSWIYNKLWSNYLYNTESSKGESPDLLMVGSLESGNLMPSNSPYGPPASTLVSRFPEWFKKVKISCWEPVCWDMKFWKSSDVLCGIRVTAVLIFPLYFISLDFIVLLMISTYFMPSIPLKIHAIISVWVLCISILKGKFKVTIDIQIRKAEATEICLRSNG
jgi:hypothetical protein